MMWGARARDLSGRVDSQHKEMLGRQGSLVTQRSRKSGD